MSECIAKGLYLVVFVLFKPSLSSSCLMISGLSVRTLDIMYDHTLFLCLQSPNRPPDVKWTAFVVIADGHF